MKQIPGGWRDVASLLDRHVADRPDAEALVGRHSRYTFAELDRAVNAGAAALQSLGVRPGDRVAATAPNHPDIIIAFLATQRIGAIWVGVNRPLAAPEKAYQLLDSGARIYLADAATIAQIQPHLPELPALGPVIDMEPGASPNGWMRMVEAHAGAVRPRTTIDPHAPAGIAYTSGTTGRPKGAVHSQHNLIFVAAATVAGLKGSQWLQSLRVGVTLPLTILNMIVIDVLPAMAGGGACVCIDRADAVGLAEWIRREGVEAFHGAPATIFDLLNHPEVAAEDLASIKFGMSGGASVSDQLCERFEAKFGAPLLSGYGSTEIPTSVTSRMIDRPSPPGSCGFTCPYLRVAALDRDDREAPLGEAGEICVRAAETGDWAHLYTPMLEYWGRPDETAEVLRNGWLHTGDVGVMDADGNIFIKDRLKELIIRGGANIYPAEVERVLKLDSRVRDAAVVGMPDERLGEVVAAFIELAPGTVAGELEPDLRAACEAQLARYKIPEVWTFVSELPRNSMNKIVKGQLLALRRELKAEL